MNSTSDVCIGSSPVEAPTEANPGPATSETAPKPKRGRPRKYESDEARQEGYAKRHKKHRKKVKALTPPTCTDQSVWDAFLRTQGLGMSAGTHMEDGKGEDGLLETGGYDEEKIARVDSQHELKEHGKRKVTTSYDFGDGDE